MYLYDFTLKNYSNKSELFRYHSGKKSLKIKQPTNKIYVNMILRLDHCNSIIKNNISILNQLCVTIWSRTSSTGVSGMSSDVVRVCVWKSRFIRAKELFLVLLLCSKIV